jgi:hypothetical protein
MRFVVPCLLLALLPIPGIGAEVPPALPSAKGVVVHEWGVWRVHEQVELANADIRDIWNNLPRFVYGQIDGRNLPRRWPNITIVDRPILFFHTPTACQVDLRIDFPRGVPAVWWPATSFPATEVRSGLGRIRIEQALARHLEWRLHLKEPPAFRKDRPPLPERVEPGHWIETLRKVAATDVFAPVGEEGHGLERERFVYYDGLLPRGQWLVPEVGKDGVRLTNRAGFPVLDVTLVDRRTPGRVLVGRLPRLDTGVKGQAVDSRPVDVGRWAKEGADTLRKQLTDAGLFDDEAGSLVELWRRELFESDGLTLFYRLPQEEYDRQLPLILRPRAEKLVRVGLVVHPHCEPDLAKRVEELVGLLGSDDFNVRQRAEKQLGDMARAAFPHLVRLRKTATDPEVRMRLRRILQRIESSSSLDEPGRARP